MALLALRTNCCRWFSRSSTRRVKLASTAIDVTNISSSRTVKGNVGVLLLGLGTGIGVGGILAWHHKQKVRSTFSQSNSAAKCLSKPDGYSQSFEAGVVKKGLPYFTLAEVAEHTTAENGIWVTYGNGVYDVSNFIDLHPGGKNKIMLAAGKSIDPFWEIFAAHNTEDVYAVLEEWRIGNVNTNNRDTFSQMQKSEDLYAADPVRSPRLIVGSEMPFWAETPTSFLVDSFLTPNNFFFVRNHLPVPEVDPKDFVLEVSGEGMKPVKLNLEDLKSNFVKYTVTATLQCAGNRRNDLAKVKPIQPPCSNGLIGNAEWTGVRLRDVLLYAGLKEADDYTPLQHVHLEGLDNDPLSGERYGASIPIHKAMDRRGDCILAYQMNGKDLPRDHGYPLRAVIPGTAGARSVKWLTQIVASKNEYGGLWQQIYYRGISDSVGNTADFEAAPAIQEMPVQSIICDPEEGSSLNLGYITISGLAWSGGGRGVVRVDVSSDGGKTWQTADLLDGSDQASGRAWAWTLWSADIQLPHKGDVELCCRAVDSSYNVQPETPSSIWNLRGYLSNAWHRVSVHIN